MPKISESLFEKSAVFAVSCVVCGLGAASSAATLAAPAAALAAVVSAIGLKRIFPPRSIERKVCDRVISTIPREFEFANEAEPESLREATEALELLLEKEHVFTIEVLGEAIESNSRVHLALLQISIDELSKSDPRFAKEGLFRDLAEHLLGSAFELVLEESEELRSKVSFVLLQQVAGKTAQTEALVNAVFQRIDNLATKSDIDGIEEKIGKANIRDTLEAGQELRGTLYLDSFFVVSFDNRSQTLGVAIGAISALKSLTRLVLSASNIAKTAQGDFPYETTRLLPL